MISSGEVSLVVALAGAAMGGLSLWPRMRADWTTASKGEVDQARSLAQQALDLLKAERELSKERSDEKELRLVQLEEAKEHLVGQVAKQALEILNLRRSVDECHGEREKALQDVLERTQAVEDRRLKIVRLEARISELEGKMKELPV